MPAMQRYPGVCYLINTTGFVCSDTLVVQAWTASRYSTGADAAGGALVVDRVSKLPVIHAKYASGQAPFMVIPLGIRVKGLSCTAMVANTSVLVYVS